ncbi:MAG: hypothetical protein QM699_14510 [Amaricoccus sp.]
MHLGLVVGVQIEHDVGVERQPEQGAAQDVELRGRCACRERGRHCRADRRDVRAGVGPEPPGHRVARRWRQIGVAAIEVGGGAGLDPAAKVALDLLGEPDRIGDRHHDHLARHLRRGQVLRQPAQHQHPGQLVGMETGLQVYLRPGAGRAEAQHLDVARRAERRLRQRDRLAPRIRDEAVPGCHDVASPRPQRPARMVFRRAAR